MKFYVCKHCGNIAEKIVDSGVDMVCCGDPMQELVPNTTDAAQEKHVPDYKVNGNTIEVQIGSTIHPMTEEHHIGWIFLETELGTQCRKLKVTDEPKAVFVLAPGDKAVTIYEWCNLHGLWKVDVK